VLGITEVSLAAGYSGFETYSVKNSGSTMGRGEAHPLSKARLEPGSASGGKANEKTFYDHYKCPVLIVSYNSNMGCE
jgi:hypothetical protein